MTARIAVAALLAALVAGCGTLDPDRAFTDATCRKVMYDDAAVKAALRGLGQTNTQLGADSVLRDAKDAAYTKCLRETGVLPPGGVERVKRGWL
jgi:hypothetical protein